MSSSPVRKSTFLRSRKAGFSLIETVIALGIVAVALIPMIGLMPIGLHTYRNSVDQMAGACIAQQITGEYEISTSQPASQTRYFDKLGQETGSGTAFNTIYYVNVVATPSYGLPGDPSTGPARQLKQLQIEVWYNPGHQSLANNLSNGLLKKNTGLQVREYSAYVAQ